jgi:glycosyltransferase involved in cell wall biosynthesis
MLKVFILSPMALENGRGGEISSIELASGLNRYYEVTFMDTNIFLGENLLSKEIIKKKLNGLEKSGRIKFATLNFMNRCFTFPYPRAILKLYRQIKLNKIIYTSIFNFKINFMFVFFSLIHRNARFIIGYRKPLHSVKLFSLYNIKYRLSILFFSLFKKRFYHHALSKSAKRFLDKFYDSKRVIHVTHGIDLKAYNNDIFQAKSPNILKFIYIGYLDDNHKGINVLVETLDEFLKEHSNLKILFEFCGMGPLEVKLKELEKKYPSIVKFHGYIRNDLVPDFYKKSDVYLFTSRAEPFPRVLMEALGAGLIIICSKTIGSVELLKGKQFAFFLNELRKSSLKEKILEIYNLWKNDPISIHNLQQLARDYVFKYYSSDIEINMFRRLINSL